MKIHVEMPITDHPKLLCELLVSLSLTLTCVEMSNA